jgi:diguanylate cyclase (GGDEF)-like protein/PAS domain S-box-containing protein
MSETTAVPLVIVSSARDPVEALNSLLRRQGIPAHCTWIPALADLPDALVQINPQLLLAVTSDGAELPQVARVRDKIAPDVPLLVVRSDLVETTMAADLAIGARDTITLSDSGRAHHVIARELRAWRAERALRETLDSAQEYRRQLETVLTRSNDAIVQVQEGIVVEANQSWLDLIGAAEADIVVGQPVMDGFDESHHAALKGALVACLQGRWSDHSLRADVKTADGGTLGLELVLTLGERDGEPCVRMMVPGRKRAAGEDLGKELSEAIRRNPRTGLFYRQPLLEAMQKRMARSVHGGGRWLVYVRPDRFAQLERDLGALRSEEFIAALAALLRAQLGPTDIAGHFSGGALMVLAERGTARDAEAWAERLREKIAAYEFDISGRRFRATACLGLASVPTGDNRLDAVVADAQEAVRRGRGQGGNHLSLASGADNDARVQAYDAVWVKHIQAALTEGRFILAQQPITSLAGGAPMSDILVRMQGRQGKEILPSEFMPAAERNELAGRIDHWVIAAAARHAVNTRPGCLFVRLTRQSALDAQLPEWIAQQLRSVGVEPWRLCIEVTESIAAHYPAEILRLAQGLKQAGIRFALEHYGTGIDPLSMLTTLPLDYVKIDGSLMQGLTEDPLLQSKVGSLIEAARERGIETIAERVEDANTMAVLWQLGVQHLQGFLIQSPEEVVMATADVQSSLQQKVVQVLNSTSQSTLR